MIVKPYAPGNPQKNLNGWLSLFLGLLCAAKVAQNSQSRAKGSVSVHFSDQEKDWKTPSIENLGA